MMNWRFLCNVHTQDPKDHEWIPVQCKTIIIVITRAIVLNGKTTLRNQAESPFVDEHKIHISEKYEKTCEKWLWCDVRFYLTKKNPPSYSPKITHVKKSMRRRKWKCWKTKSSEWEMILKSHLRYENLLKIT